MALPLHIALAVAAQPVEVSRLTTPKPLLPRGRLRIGTGDICLGHRAIRLGLDAGSIGAPLDPGTAAGPLLKTLTREISRASRTTIHVIGLEAGSIGAALETGTAAGTLLKTSAIEISRASGTTTHAIALEAVTIRTRLGPGAATEPPPGHVAVITHPWAPP